MNAVEWAFVPVVLMLLAVLVEIGINAWELRK